MRCGTEAVVVSTDGGGSWPSVTNPADSINAGKSASTFRKLKRPLTERDGVSLRQEVYDYDDLSGDRPLTWRDTIWSYRDYIRDKKDVTTVLGNTETGEHVRKQHPHRFHPDYSGKQYAKLKDLERGLRDDYGKRLHTAMLTFTASARRGDDLAGPVDHLHDLDSSWSAVTRELRRRLEGRRYERLAILETHPGDGVNGGYLHIHMAVFVEGVVTRSDLAPVIEAHLRNCDHAEREAHDVRDDSTISIRRVGTERGEDTIGNLGTYLAEYLGAYGDDPLDAPEHVQMGNAVLWATGKQRWRPSNGAQEYMKNPEADDDDGDEWELVGIERDGELHECTSDGGGVEMFTTSTGLDPPDG